MDEEKEKYLVERFLQWVVNDLLCRNEASEEYQSAEEWLFGEQEEDSEEGDYIAWDVVSGMLGVDKDKVRFMVRWIQDQGGRGHRGLQGEEWDKFLQYCKKS